ncbi:uncharacterized protein LOC107800681 [Nicotiana tabacum]|uniref:Uncharacterized protein LOC107800681 n=2 Tax=Nicotiana TaxID=4085 RepID=A0A1S4ASA6_TOBAC|nr:PREDICTED: uncharacterized protein LOC104235351 [Nicotiana sylvestris]XP_016479393.1 PREDICTED: uncharacterized protein LOC107800681 [Nicotiana tabacum]
MVMEGIQEDMGDGNMICTNHPYKNNTPGGICAFCLQEKLGKLVSSSFPSAIFPSSSTPSFRSDFGTTSSTLPVLQTNNIQTNIQTSVCNNFNHYNTMRKSRMPFLLSTQNRRKNKKKDGSSNSSIVATTSASASNVGISMKRSKSTTTPRNHMHFLDNADEAEEDYTPHRKRFWSFLYYSSSKHSSSSISKKTEKTIKDMSFASSSSVGASVHGSMSRSREKKKEEFIVVEENESPNEAAFDRKVSRSRSVGCGSRSFSGDFFERISTGFGDCTLRRVESQREGKSKVSSVHNHRSNGSSTSGQDCIKERVRCGGLFSGFMITSSSSSSSSSSHWVSSEENVNGKSSIAPASVGHQLVHGRNKSWGWAFASPMRAFSSKTSSSNGKTDASNKNATPNLAAIPSLLTARG